mmetsp:Transcript_7833/g.23031  ORF Transcript_7833/g.23031 Transcript_7833/m.23031 type:complete len:260 (-) Transcript_7833:1-780(-)
MHVRSCCKYCGALHRATCSRQLVVIHSTKQVPCTTDGRIHICIQAFMNNIMNSPTVSIPRSPNRFMLTSLRFIHDSWLFLSADSYHAIDCAHVCTLLRLPVPFRSVPIPIHSSSSKENFRLARRYTTLPLPRCALLVPLPLSGSVWSAPYPAAPLLSLFRLANPGKSGTVPRSSCKGCPAGSQPPGSRQGVTAPVSRVPEATMSNHAGLATNDSFTNWAIMAPIRPLAAHTPSPVDRTGVGKSSEVMVSMVFQAMVEKH